jgi:hypothetical protein
MAIRRKGNKWQLLTPAGQVVRTFAKEAEAEAADARRDWEHAETKVETPDAGPFRSAPKPGRPA